MNRNHWTRRRAANRLTKSKKRDHDQANAEAAGSILSAPERHSRFLLDWAQAFQRRHFRFFH